MKKKVLTGFLVFILVLSIYPLQVQAENADICTIQFSVKYGQTEARKMLGLINDFRKGSEAWYYKDNNKRKKKKVTGLKKLSYNYKLEQTAMQRAAELAILFEHQRPDGTMFNTAFPIQYSGNGENILISSYTTTSKQAMNIWKETDFGYYGQGHRRNMLEEGYQSIGVGHASYKGIHFWVQDFSYTKHATTKPKAADSNRKVSVRVKNEYIESAKRTSNSSTIHSYCGKMVTLPKPAFKIKVMNAFGAETIFNVNAAGTWSVSNDNYANISGDQIKGIKAGTIKAYMKAFGKTYTYPVKVSHDWRERITKTATLSEKGSMDLECRGCHVKKSQINDSPKKVSFSKSVYPYNGKVQKPNVLVKDSAGKTISSKDYSVTYYGKRKNVGTYKVKVTMREPKFKGILYNTFKIVPTGTSISKVSAGSRAFTIKWKKKRTQTTGYQIQYSTNRKYKGSKTKTISSYKTTSKKMENLKRKKKYYVRIRTYKKVKTSGRYVKFYSGWSKTRSVKTRA